MKETPKSLRAYFAVVGVLAAYTSVFGIGKWSIGLTRTLSFTSTAPTWFWMLYLVGPVIQLGAGAIFLYLAWRLPRLLASDSKPARTPFVVIAALLLAHGLIDWLLGFGLLSLAASAAGLLIIWYLYSSVRRLQAERATDLTSAST